MSLEKAVIASIHKGKKKFEILVDSDAAFSYKRGEKVSLEKVLITPVVFRDAKKGEKASSSELKEAFGTSDVYEVAKFILDHGKVQLTAKQIRELIEEKKRRIVAIIARNYVDPRTGKPHTPARIEAALKQAKVRVDPFVEAEQQVENVVKALKMILPLKAEVTRLTVTVPPRYASKAYGVVKSYGEIERSEWLGDGSLRVVITLPTGLSGEFMGRINEVTKGEAVVKIEKQ